MVSARVGQASMHRPHRMQRRYLIDRSVPLTGRVPLVRRVVPALDVDGVRRAGPRAQLAADALLQPVRPPVELVMTVEPRRGRPLVLRILDGLDLPEHLLEGDPEPLDRVEEIKHL
jgi:hypothetical protein